ncbi:MAG: outer membrane lipoprotein-sorting protein [Sedimentisphaerales bacterium]|nr:outer membrane lipoprotein-sorting protein [Sedimentisphaerales bacterium]
MSFSRIAVWVLLCSVMVWADNETANQDKTPEKTETPDVSTIVNKANFMAYYQGQDGKSRVKMTITDKNNTVRIREFNILRKDKQDGGDQFFYVYFLKPADVRKMVFMVHKHTDIDKDDDRWLYMPSIDNVKRISAGDKRTSFVGSDFLYEDVSGRSLQEDTHEIIETTDKHYVIKNVPKDKKNVEFSYYNVWINRDNYMPVKMEYYDSNNKMYRKIEALTIETIQNYPTVVKSQVTDLAKNSTTVMEFSNVEYDIKLDDIFTERYLRRPPREAMR